MKTAAHPRRAGARRTRRRPPEPRPASSAGRAACTRSRRRASPRRPCARSSRTRPPHTRARRSAARAPRRSGRGRGRPGGSRRLRARAPRALRGTPRSGFRPRASSTRSSCDTAAPESARDRWRGVEVEAHARPYNACHETLEVVVARPPADGRADQAAPGQIAHDDAGVGEPRDDRRRLLRGRAPRDERGALLRHDDVLARRRRAARGSARPSPLPARSAHGGIARDRGPKPCDGRARRDVRIEPRRARLRLERAVLLVAVLREVARAADAKRVRVGDDERAGPLRPAQPLLPGDGVEVEARSRRPASRRPTALRRRGSGGPVAARSSCTGRTAPVVQRTCESAMSRVRGVTAATIRSGSGSTTTTFAPDVWSGPRRPKCSSVVVITSSPARRSRPGEHDVAAVRRRRGERDLLGVDADERGELGAQLLARVEQAHEPRVAAAAFLAARAPPRRASRRSSRARAGPTLPACRYA